MVCGVARLASQRGYAEPRSDPWGGGGFRGKRVLDVGCNDGFYGFEAEKRGADVVLVDARKAATDRAELVKARFGHKAEIVCGDLQEMSLSEPSLAAPFDCTLFYGLLYHLSDPIETLRKMGSRTQRVIAIQTFINAFDDDPMFRIIDEPVGEPGAGTTSIVTTPSQAAIAKCLLYAGFDHVYRAMPSPYSGGQINPEMRPGWHWAFFYGVKGDPVDLPGLVAISDRTRPLSPYLIPHQIADRAVQWLKRAVRRART